jgi:hypothetical protein
MAEPEKTPYEKLLQQIGVSGHPVFRCDHPGCRAYACHGHGVFLRKGIRGTWFCSSHEKLQAADAAMPRAAHGVREEAPHAPAAQPAISAPSIPSAPNRQGALW